jgi:hypothetical protein
VCGSRIIKKFAEDKKTTVRDALEADRVKATALVRINC